MCHKIVIISVRKGTLYYDSGHVFDVPDGAGQARSSPPQICRHLLYAHGDVSKHDLRLRWWEWVEMLNDGFVCNLRRYVALYVAPTMEHDRDEMEMAH